MVGLKSIASKLLRSNRTYKLYCNNIGIGNIKNNLLFCDPIKKLTEVYPMAGTSPHQLVCQLIDNWQTDWKYSDLIVSVCFSIIESGVNLGKKNYRNHWPHYNIDLFSQSSNKVIIMLLSKKHWCKRGNPKTEYHNKKKVSFLDKHVFVQRQKMYSKL